MCECVCVVFMCSQRIEEDKIEEKHHILTALQQNGYPKEFIKKHSKSTTGEKNSQESA